MALLVPNVVLSSDYNLENAYIRVSRINGNKSILTFEIDIFPSEEIANSGVHPIESTLYSFVPSQDEYSVRWDKQAYEFIKTREIFSDAIDC